MTALIPDFEKLVADYLSADPATSALIGDRIFGRTPSQTEDAWLVVTSLGPADGGHPDHLIAALMQIDCYAGADRTTAQQEVNLIARTVRAALKEMNTASHDGAVVSDVRILSAPRIPDTDLEPARERIPMTVSVSAHSV